MEYLFRESENNYQNRSLSMLDYTSDNILEGLNRMSILRKLPQFYRTIESFKNFFDTNFVDIYLSNNIDIEKIEEL